MFISIICIYEKIRTNPRIQAVFGGRCAPLKGADGPLPAQIPLPTGRATFTADEKKPRRLFGAVVLGRVGANQLAMAWALSFSVTKESA